MASICKLVGLCEAFNGFRYNVMVCYSSPLYLMSHTTLADIEFVLLIDLQHGVLVPDDTGSNNRSPAESSCTN